jgi:hypothetical protein
MVTGSDDVVEYYRPNTAIDDLVSLNHVGHCRPRLASKARQEITEIITRFDERKINALQQTSWRKVIPSQSKTLEMLDTTTNARSIWVWVAEAGGDSLVNTNKSSLWFLIDFLITIPESAV